MRLIPLLILLPVLAPHPAPARNRALTPAHAPVVANGAVSVPGCPDWSGADRSDAEATLANFGCATASNLAGMVADPADLLRGRDDGAIPAGTAVRAVRAAREIEPGYKKWQAPVETGVGGPRR